MQKISTRKFTNISVNLKIINLTFLFIFCSSFVNLQNAKAISFLEYFFNSQGITLQNNKDVETVFTKILFLTGFAKKTQEAQELANPVFTNSTGFNEDKAKRDPVCNSNNNMYYDQPKCNDIINQGKQLDNLQKVAAGTGQSSGSQSGSPAQGGGSSPEFPNASSGSFDPSSGSGGSSSSGGSGSSPASGGGGNSASTQSSENENAPTGGSIPQADNSSLGADKNFQISQISDLCKPNWGVNIGGSCTKTMTVPLVKEKLRQDTATLCTLLKTRIESQSVHRSFACNKAVYDRMGKPPTQSQHINGVAIDYGLTGDKTKDYLAYKFFLSKGYRGIGCYGGQKFVHFDFGPARRWGSGCPADLEKAIGEIGNSKPSV
jgi:uncharacterized protein YcbK (DUF882 family)